jgi:hypothetical protein
MTASMFMGGDLEGRVYLTCDGCGKQHTIRSYTITKTRTHAANRGWVRTGAPHHGRDWCDTCTPPADVTDPAAVPSLFDLLDLEMSA